MPEQQASMYAGQSEDHDLQEHEEPHPTTSKLQVPAGLHDQSRVSISLQWAAS